MSITKSSLDSKTNDKIPSDNKIGNFAIPSAPIIMMMSGIVAYFRYILAIIRVPQDISIIATRKRVVVGNGSPKLKNIPLKSDTNNFTIPDEIKTYPIA